ncbi:MAG: regulatory signaling modulator protein AmpE [Firmicutes bacterium]|nr:regulatory signaling modulator protein AmpE [Bacillota bacterium]
MVIFSLLIAILIDRAMRNRGHWQLKPIADTWHQHFARLRTRNAVAEHAPLQVLIWIAPALLFALLVYLQGSLLLAFIVNVLVLLISLGCGPQRALVRSYLAKAQHHQPEHCMQLQQRLVALQPELAGQSVGAHIIWLNFRYYFAVAAWFIVFGAAGALVYALMREYVVGGYDNQPLAPEADEAPEPKPEQNSLFARILYWMEWPAARIAGFAYLLVGHFSRALPVWLKGVAAIQPSHSDYLIGVARKAEDGCEPNPENAAHELTDEPCAMLTLAKRSMILLLAATALATLFGWLG